jgi:hypothetical protein
MKLFGLSLLIKRSSAQASEGTPIDAFRNLSVEARGQLLDEVLSHDGRFDAIAPSLEDALRTPRTISAEAQIMRSIESAPDKTVVFTESSPFVVTGEEFSDPWLALAKLREGQYYISVGIKRDPTNPEAGTEWTLLPSMESLTRWWASKGRAFVEGE